MDILCGSIYSRIFAEIQLMFFISPDQVLETSQAPPYGLKALTRSGKKLEIEKKLKKKNSKFFNFNFFHI